MAGLTIAVLVMLFASLSLQAQPTAAEDAELWTAAVEQVQRDLQVQNQGELLILNQSLQTAELHSVRAEAIREPRLFDLLRQRNDSTRKAITGIRLPRRTRLVEANSVQNWNAKRPPGEKLVRFSLPAFSEDGAKGIVYYSATGGFDDSQGGYMIFEKNHGQWIVVDYVGMWIT